MGAPTYGAVSASVALSASATKSLVLVSPAVVGIRLTELGVSFDASAISTAVRVDLYRTTTLGTPAGTSTTPVKANDTNAAAAQSTALTALTTEPTAVEVLRSWFVQPFGGVLIVQFPLGREPVAPPAGARLGVRVVTPASVTPNAVGYFEIEE